MTFTTFAPPPSGTLCSRKYQEIVSSGRVIAASATSPATPTPTSPARTASRARRSGEDSSGLDSRQPRERHQHEDGRDHLDGELGQGEIRRGEVEEGERHDEPDRRPARIDGDEALAVPDHAAERGRREHESRHDAERRERHERAVAGWDRRCRGAAPATEHERDREEQRERALQRAVVEPVREARSATRRGRSMSRWNSEPRGPPRRHVQVQVVLALQRPVDRPRRRRTPATLSSERGGEAVPERDRVRRAGRAAEHRARRARSTSGADGQRRAAGRPRCRPRPASRPAPS